MTEEADTASHHNSFQGKGAGGYKVCLQTSVYVANKYFMGLYTETKIMPHLKIILIFGVHIWYFLSALKQKGNMPNINTSNVNYSYV
jgi:hypothetical protein